jgi:hypothetical protein
MINLITNPGLRGNKYRVLLDGRKDIFDKRN